MPHVIFTLKDGSVRAVDCAAGTTMMEAAAHNSVPGIEAVCGGQCSCATCHVYVDAAWADRLPAPSEDEDAMLDGTAADRLPTSRLACQIRITEALDGIAARMPDLQA